MTPLGQAQRPDDQQQGSNHLLIGGSIVLGCLTFAVLLTYHNLADGDMWARLAAGAAVLRNGTVMPRDIFAFTPILPAWVDHEWGMGFLLFALLRAYGPGSLMLLKLATGLGAILVALLAGRRLKAPWPALLLLAIPCTITVLPGYVPVIRSHAFTYLFFALSLLCLEASRQGRRHAVWLLVPVMVVWTNVHGGFVAGLGMIGVYTGWAVLTRKNWLTMLPAASACGLATLLNPYGWRFWQYLLPALLHRREAIAEWQPMRFQGMDAFAGFRFLLVLVVLVAIVGWRSTKSDRSWPGCIMLVLTAYLAISSRRHAPFFGLTALAVAGPWLKAALDGLAKRIPKSVRRDFSAELAVLFLYTAVAAVVAVKFLPSASFQVLAPVGFYPVREVDILRQARVEGNVAVPFRWGSYVMWRAYPQIKVSIDGRYEETYPEATFAMNDDFYAKRGATWDRLLTSYDVPFVILETSRTALRPGDLVERGYRAVWSGPSSALFVRHDYADQLSAIAASLPDTTEEPLDATIPKRWGWE